MIEIVHCLRHRRRHTRHFLQILKRRAAYRPCRAEVHEQRLFARGADAGNFVERAGGNRLAPLRPVCADGKAVGFVAEALEIEQHWRVDWQVEFATVGEMEGLAPCMAVGAFRDANKADVLDADFLQRCLDRADLALAAVDQH